MKPKIIVIVGPTASGKSALAVRIAKKFNGEIISADSRQVYRGLDIGSGKISKREMAGIPHHLLSVANPKNIFSVSDFKNESEKIIKVIQNKNKIPIICGGTGFYIDSVVFNTNLPEVPPNRSLRKKLEKKSAEELFLILKKKDPRRAGIIDPNNKVRLIRALEIISALRRVPAFNQKIMFQSIFVGLKPKDRNLKIKIHTRLLHRMRAGMISEVKKLHKNGLSWKRLEDLGLEYKWLAFFLQNKISKQEMLTGLETAIWRYSRRQMTWFRKNKKIEWFDAGKKNFKRDIVKSLTKFLI